MHRPGGPFRMAVAPLRRVRPRTIVVPLDGSSLAEAALPVAHQLAGAFRAAVQRVTVLDGGGDRQVRIDTALTGADPATALLDHLDSLEAPLVVLSAHGHGGLTRRLVGSVAEAVIRRAHCPVVVVGPNQDRSLPNLGPRSLVVAVGYPPVPERLLTAAGGWATALRASVTLVHVRRSSPPRGPDGSPLDPPDLDALAAPLRADGIDVRTTIPAGDDPPAVLLELADAQPPPVLLMAQTHRAGADHATTDVTYRLLQRSRWPVLATVGTDQPGG